MDVAEFVRVHQRMCDEYNTCRGCPMDGKCNPCTEAVYKDPQGVVSIVEEWSKANPVQTNADKFKEVFGIPPTAKVDSFMGCVIGVIADWWDEEYKAPQEDNE